MKKLALALVCLVSVAFFASCEKPNQNPEPTIAVTQAEGYVADGDVVNVNETIQFGFSCAANTQSGKNLAKLVVSVETFDIDGTSTGAIEWANIDTLTGKEYNYTDAITFAPGRDEILGTAVITAVVTDAAGETATATINLSINNPAQPLIGRAIEWIRKGANLLNNTEEEMKNCGLQWTGSYKEVFATIKPIEGASMYLCNGDDFATLTTTTEKAAYFANLVETGTAVESYRKITTNNSANYNDMLAVVNGENTYLVLISRAEIETGSYGTQITIKGEAK